MLSKLSWKTSALGISAILVGVGAFLKAANDGDPSTVADMPALFAAVLAGIGLIFARDNNKSSEQVGAR